VATVKVAVVDPFATVTVAGTEIKPNADERLTVTFPVGALLSVIVPVVVPPAVTLDGERLREVMAYSTTVKIAFADECGLVAYRLKE
jgi:hypothetical protein